MNVRFFLLHHASCATVATVHWDVASDGTVTPDQPETSGAQHEPIGQLDEKSIAIRLEGDCDIAPPPAAQMTALKALLVDLSLRYPSASVGGHRQVRGIARGTTCPGGQFELQALLDWSRNEMITARDARIRARFEASYHGKSFE